MKEIHFILDEDLEHSTKELQSIINAVDKDTNIEKKANVLKKFVRAAVYSLKPQNLIRKEELIKPRIQQKPLTLLSRLFVSNSPAPVVKRILPKKETVVIKPIVPQEIKQELIQKDLILDKITNKVLAYVKLTDKYYLVEPILDDNDTKVLNKVLYKRPKNMEKGWKLISKYGSKFSVPTDHFTNIKYFVVNFLFGLGRVEPLVYDKDIKEIYCDGANKPVRIKFNDKILETNITYPSKEELDIFLCDLGYRVKQKLKKKNPKINFNYREMNFEVSMSFTPDQQSTFIVKK